MVAPGESLNLRPEGAGIYIRNPDSNRRAPVVTSEQAHQNTKYASQSQIPAGSISTLIYFRFASAFRLEINIDVCLAA